jgi:hypothetical protein
MGTEEIKSYVITRFGSYPGAPIPEELIDEALRFIPERIANRFSVLYTQSPTDWNRITADIGTAIEEWKAGRESEAVLRMVKALLETCV